MSKFVTRINKRWESFITKPGIFNFLPHNLILFIFFIISIITIVSFGFKNKVMDDVLYSQVIADGVVDPIVVDPVEISFKDKDLKGKPEKLCLTFATYSREKSDSSYKFVLYHKEEVIKEEAFNSKVLKDGEDYCFDISLVDKKNYKEYKAEIVPVYTDLDNVITIFKNSKTNDLAMRILGTDQNRVIKGVVGCFFIGIFLFLNYLANTKKIAYEKWWLLFAFSYALPIMFIYPPYQIPDEPVHFYNSYMLTQLDITKPLYKSVNNKTFIAPESLDCLNYSKIEVLDKVIDLKDIKDCLRNVDNKKMPNIYWSTQSKLGYIGNAIGIKLGDIISNSSLVIFMMGRLVTLLLAIGLIYIAIKITPKYKEIFLTIATIPMFIQEMGSFSYDSLLNAIILLIMAVIIKLIYEDRVSLKYLGIILGGGIFIADIKMIYLPVILLMLLIPSKKFKKSYYKYIYCLGIIILSYMGGSLTKAIFANGSVAVVDPNSYNLQYVLKHPAFILEVAYNTLAKNSMLYLRSLIGYFGWFKFRLSDIYIVAYLIYMGYLVRYNKLDYEKKKDKGIIIGGILLSLAAVFASMYFTWSAEGLNYVDGVQGRYFIPLLIPILLMFMRRKERGKVNNKIVVNFINIVLLQYILTLVLYYY